jgi:hypothetical protein
MPTPVLSTDRATLAIATLHEAVAAATRTSLDAIRHPGLARALFVPFAIDQGWRDTTLLAELAGCSTQTIRRHLGGTDVPGLCAARLCAGDARLLQRAQPREIPRHGGRRRHDPSRVDSTRA